MKKIIKVLCIICILAGMLVQAVHANSADVQIAIEKSEMEATERMTSVKTGDEEHPTGYLLAACLVLALGGICVWRKKRRGLLLLALFCSFFWMSHSAQASENRPVVSVTVPANVNIEFAEDGTAKVSDFTIQNDSLLPTIIRQVYVTECNDWTLCGQDEEIASNTKKLAFVFEGKELQAGDNTLALEIPEETDKTCEIQIHRGVWTTSQIAETAMKLEFEYTMGRKKFLLQFDTNGYEGTVESQMLYNGAIITLPNLEREGYVFEGWQDKRGYIYTGEYVMPIGDSVLQAQWKKKVPYALVLKEDSSLRFVCSGNPFYVGSTYKGLTVSEVYTGFESEKYGSKEEVPWYDGNTYQNRPIKKIVVEDELHPISTAYWFQYMAQCEYVDVRKLDTSNVTDMGYMFAWTCFQTPTYEVYGLNDFQTSKVTNMEYTFAYMARDVSTLVINLENWDVSHVTNMNHMFSGVGLFATTFSLGDLGKWDVSSVTNMNSMFDQTGYYADWLLDIRGWDIRKVTDSIHFNFLVKNKVLEPDWPE